MSDWRIHAACGGSDPHLWFAPEVETAHARQVREATAMAICRPCPVRNPCLDDALSEPAQYGIRGGVSEEKRQALRHALVKRQQREQEAA